MKFSKGTETLFERIIEKRAYVYGRFNSKRLHESRPSDIEKVLVIDSASRSGSSLLYYMLSEHPDVISLNGEGVVFEKLHGVCPVNAREDSDSDSGRKPPPDAVLAGVAEDILRDAGVLYKGGTENFPEDNFLSDSVQRLLLQYAERELDPDAIYRVCARALAKQPVAGNKNSTSAGYWRMVLTALGGGSFSALSRHYDIGKREGQRIAARRVFPPSPPFLEKCLEEPPFVVPRPRIFPSRTELKRKILLLKSSADCYRMRLIKRLFPRARHKFVFLSRNPAAAVNGLMEGWLSGGFYSVNLSGIARLDIKGYSNDSSPWSRIWWKFDLPPGWHEFSRSPLEEVCAFQWLCANEHILRDIRERVIEERLQVRYEDILNPVTRRRELGKILDFAGLAKSPVCCDKIPPVMAVTLPRAGKWKARRACVSAVISGARMRDMARSLGYDFKEMENWP